MGELEIVGKLVVGRVEGECWDCSGGLVLDHRLALVLDDHRLVLARSW